MVLFWSFIVVFKVVMNCVKGEYEKVLVFSIFLLLFVVVLIVDKCISVFCRVIWVCCIDFGIIFDVYY